MMSPAYEEGVGASDREGVDSKDTDTDTDVVVDMDMGDDNINVNTHSSTRLLAATACHIFILHFASFCSSRTEKSYFVPIFERTE